MTWESTLLKALEQAPIVTIFAVFVYLMFRRADGALTTIGDNCHKHGAIREERLGKVVADNEKVIERAVSVLDRALETMGEIRGLLRRANGRRPE